MALNIATFKTRAATAGIFVAVMLLGWLWNHWSFLMLCSLIHFGCWYEYQKLVRHIDPRYAAITPFHQYGVMIAGWCLMLYFTNDAFSLLGIQLHAIGWWLGLIALFALPVMELLFSRQLEARNMAYSAFGLLYISLSLAMMVDLRCYGMNSGQQHGFNIMECMLPLGVLLAIWINDTMAYIVGSFIGKTPFSSISPKKTWEGTAGGALLCIAVIGLLGWWSTTYTVKDWLIIALLAAVFGVLGDLFESKLKRMAAVKDSGSIMPGHGGFLDRFDSLLLATPMVWLYVTLFMK